MSDADIPVLKEMARSDTSMVTFETSPAVCLIMEQHLPGQ